MFNYILVGNGSFALNLPAGRRVAKRVIRTCENPIYFKIGWEWGIRTPDAGFRVRSLTTWRIPNIVGFYILSHVSQMILRKTVLPCRDLRYFSLNIASLRVAKFSCMTRTSGNRDFVEGTIQLLCLNKRLSKLFVWPIYYFWSLRLFKM